MHTAALHLTGVERHFGDNELIVSKTDTRGIISYANDVFLDLAGIPRDQVVGMPHNCIRHPQMPHSVFKLLWDTISAGDEIFAYVINRSLNGDHYWVYAHVTPSYDSRGKIVGYHSNRRNPRRDTIEKIIPIYQLLSETESRHTSQKDGIEAATNLLLQFLKDKGTDYEKFIHTL